jgi:hypothetical protein
MEERGFRKVKIFSQSNLTQSMPWEIEWRVRSQNQRCRTESWWSGNRYQPFFSLIQKRNIKESNNKLKQKLILQVQVPFYCMPFVYWGTCLCFRWLPTRPAVYIFSSLDTGQCSKPQAGQGKLISSIIAFSQVGRLPFSFTQVILMTY